MGIGSISNFDSIMLDILIFVFLQGLVINGFQQSMEDGMILEGYKKWLKKQKSWIGKPGGLCIKCLSSIGGTITFWPVVLFMYGWHPVELFVWVLDMLSLVVVNFWVFKKM